MNGLVAYDSSDSETEEQQEFEGHLGHLKKQTPEVPKSPPKRKPSAGSVASPAQKPLGMRFHFFSNFLSWIVRNVFGENFKKIFFFRIFFFEN